MKRQNGEVKRAAAFVKAAFRLNLKPGEAGTFECPICGQTAIAKAARQNGHIHTACSGCNALLME